MNKEYICERCSSKLIVAKMNYLSCKCIPCYFNYVYYNCSGINVAIGEDSITIIIPYLKLQSYCIKKDGLFHVKNMSIENNLFILDKPIEFNCISDTINGVKKFYENHIFF